MVFPKAKFLWPDLKIYHFVKHGLYFLWLLILISYFTYENLHDNPNFNCRETWPRFNIKKMTITMNNLDFRCGSHWWIHCMKPWWISSWNSDKPKSEPMEPTSSNSQMRKVINYELNANWSKLKPCDYVWNWAKNEFLYEANSHFTNKP